MTGGTSILALGLTLLAAPTQAPPSSSQTIAGAVLPLPEQLRSGATVVRLDASFRPEVLRQGANGIVCIADAPNDDRFDVTVSAGDTFIPVVYRAFQLGYQVSGEKVQAEIKAGKLKLSPEPTAGCRCLRPNLRLRLVPRRRQCSSRMLAVDSLPLPDGGRGRVSR